MTHFASRASIALVSAVVFLFAGYIAASIDFVNLLVGVAALGIDPVLIGLALLIGFTGHKWYWLLIWSGLIAIGLEAMVAQGAVKFGESFWFAFGQGLVPRFAAASLWALAFAYLVQKARARK